MCLLRQKYSPAVQAPPARHHFRHQEDLQKWSARGRGVWMTADPPDDENFNSDILHMCRTCLSVLICVWGCSRSCADAETYAESQVYPALYRAAQLYYVNYAEILWRFCTVLHRSHVGSLIWCSFFKIKKLVVGMT